MEGKYILAGFAGIIDGLTKGLEARRRQDLQEKELALKEQFYNLQAQKSSVNEDYIGVRIKDIQSQREHQEQKTRNEAVKLNTDQLKAAADASESYNKSIKALKDDRLKLERRRGRFAEEDKQGEEYKAVLKQIEEKDADISKQEEEKSFFLKQFGGSKTPSAPTVKYSPEGENSLRILDSSTNRLHLEQALISIKSVKNKEEQNRLMDLLKKRAKFLDSAQSSGPMMEP